MIVVINVFIKVIINCVFKMILKVEINFFLKNVVFLKIKFILFVMNCLVKEVICFFFKEKNKLRINVKKKDNLIDLILDSEVIIKLILVCKYFCMLDFFKNLIIYFIIVLLFGLL